MADMVKCKHCGEKRPALGFAPLPNELGQRIATEICQPCWAAWLPFLHFSACLLTLYLHRNFLSLYGMHPGT